MHGRFSKAGSDSKVASFKPPKYLHRNPDEYKKLVIVKGFIDTIPKFVDGTITYQCGVKSETYSKTTGKQKKSLEPKYLVTVLFERIKYRNEPTPLSSEVVTYRNKLRYFTEPRWNKNPVKMSCQCQDFKFKFHWDLASFGGLIGKRQPYDRITADPTKANFKAFENGELEKKPRDFANPTGKIGYCKHINTLLLELKRRGWVLEV